ncbi:MAG: hypothetical protein ACTHM6_09205 [Tepidisphaeraceae bacterium]
MGPTLDYSPPVIQPSRPLMVAAVLGAFAIALLVIGGCFLVGIGLMYDLLQFGKVSPDPWSAGQIAYVSALWVCAVGSFGSGSALMILAIRKALTA